jgi:hypothetical protein
VPQAPGLSPVHPPLADLPSISQPSIRAILPGMVKETIKTSLGPLWIEHISSGETRIPWPYASRAGELAIGVLEGKARWPPKSKGWYVAAARLDEITQELTAL